MRRFVLALLFGAVLAWGAWSVHAGTRTLVWTNPRFNAAVGDSGEVLCGVDGDTLRDLNHIEVWGWPVAGGGPRIVITRPAMGREGMVDSAKVDVSWGWHFFLKTVDNSGHSSCESPMVFLCGPCLLTGVDLPPEDPIVSVRYYDVHGRRIGPEWKASGIRWRVTTYRSGRREVKKEIEIR